MSAAGYQLLLLIAAVCFIVWMTAYKKVNAFFVLLLAAVAIGFLSGLPDDKIVVTLKAGFGHTMEKIGLLIILGTTLGVLLEKTGATISLASAILGLVKERNAPVAIALTGFLIGIPIFCDSGFIILSGLNHSLVQKGHQRMTVMASALATSLYSVHCLVPPHPGLTAAIGTASGDVGTVMLWGLALAIPGAVVGCVWSVWRGSKVSHEYTKPEAITAGATNFPRALLAALPVALPIVLIATKSVLTLYGATTASARTLPLQLLSFLGEPVIALGVGILFSFVLVRKESKDKVPHWLADGVEKAGMVLAIIAGGGMFGEMLQATGASNHLGVLLSKASLGIFFPFLVAAVFKTAQGSSTVAVVAAASLVTPLLPGLGLEKGTGLTLALLSMGAGSMVASHANDAYFWVISRFSALETGATLKVYTVATVLMGLTVQVLIWILWLVLR